MKSEFREKIFVNRKNVTLYLWLITKFRISFNFRTFKYSLFFRVSFLSQNIRLSLCLLVFVVWFVCFIFKLSVLTFGTIYLWKYFCFSFSVLFCLICYLSCHVFSFVCSIFCFVFCSVFFLISFDLFCLTWLIFCLDFVEFFFSYKKLCIFRMFV